MSEEPTYECDYDRECGCTEQGIEGEWQWNAEQEYWYCAGCGEIQ